VVAGISVIADKVEAARRLAVDKIDRAVIRINSETVDVASLASGLAFAIETDSFAFAEGIVVGKSLD